MLRDHEDLIGDIPTDNIGETLSYKTEDINSVIGGVSVSWLMRAFRMSRSKVESKLIACKPIGIGRRGVALYDLPEAASYLVNPRVDLDEYLKGLKPDALPERLREGYWNAMLKQQRWEEKAGQLWRTEKVLDVFSEVLQDMRTKLQLVPESIHRAAGLSEKQHRAATEVVDAIQDDIYQWLIQFAKRGKTLNQLGERDADGNGDDEDDEDDLI